MAAAPLIPVAAAAGLEDTSRTGGSGLLAATCRAPGAGPDPPWVSASVRPAANSAATATAAAPTRHRALLTSLRHWLRPWAWSRPHSLRAWTALWLASLRATIWIWFWICLRTWISPGYPTRSRPAAPPPPALAAGK
jgi:hypothetical protein